MKKTNLLIFLFLLFQFNSFSQVSIGVKAGMTQFWAKPNPYYTQSIILGPHSGIDIKIPVLNNRYAISLGYEQHDVMAKSGFWYFKSNSGSTKEPVPDQRIERYQSFPILAFYRFKRLELFAGYELKLVQIGPSDEQPDFQNYSFTEHGLVSGLEYRIGKNFALAGKLYVGAFGKPDLGPTRIISRISSGLSLKYYLKVR